MRTAFSATQLSDPAIEAMDRILRKCVHCGFCNATCPTYQLTGDELDGPRGRIYLLKDMLEAESIPGEKVVNHLDRCLSCLSCMTTCPSGVDYMHLVDHGRDYIEQNHRRRWMDRIQRSMLAKILPAPGRFRMFMGLARIMGPLQGLFPKSLASGLKLSTNTKVSDSNGALDEYYAASGEKKGTVGLLPGCAQQVIGNEINLATIRVLTRSGYDVHILNQTACCGAIEHHLGKASLALDRITSNLRNWSSILPGLDAIISNASGCGTMIKDYGHLTKGNADLVPLGELASSKTMDICEFLAQQNAVPEAANFENLKVAYQSPCSMHHGQKITKEPIALLGKSGFDVAVLPEDHLCCGSAGTYNILQPAMAEKLGQRKSANIESTHADVVASGNLGCMLQLRQYSNLPFVHTIELLDWATGGPAPAVLANIKTKQA